MNSIPKENIVLYQTLTKCIDCLSDKHNLTKDQVDELNELLSDQT